MSSVLTTRNRVPQELADEIAAFNYRRRFPLGHDDD
jgi:hypothetical protein